jgi:hypothetical protein
MPNWKKVIVSGSDAALNSLNVTSLLSVTGSSNLTGSLDISGSASILGNTGTTTFYTNADTLIFTGSVFISGSIIQTGSLNITSITSSLFGTSSWSENAISSSYALTASYALNGGGGGGGAFTYHQTSSAVTWSVSHSLDTYTPIVQVYDDHYNQIIPASISGSSTNTIQITFSTAETGYAVLTTGGSVTVNISGSNATLVQSIAATTWSFYHGLNETYPVFTIFDSNDDVIVPLRIHADNANTASIYFTTARTGTAVAANCGLSGSTFESASYAATASYALNVPTASVSASYANTASYVENAQTASYVLNAVSASYALTASFVTLAQTASYVLNAVSASHAQRAISSSYALTASYAENITISGSITDVDYINFDTASSFTNTAGRLGWDNGEGTLQLGLAGGNVQYSVGETLYAYAYNAEPTTLTKGQVVYISGSQGNRVAVKLASDAADPSSAGTLGLVAETITSGGTGWVITEGPLRKLNTLGLTAGKLVFLSSTPGGITQTPATAPSHSVRLGYVERVSATVGSIFVKVDNGYEIGELHDVVDSTTSGSYGDLFVKSGSVWINSKQLTGSYGLTGSLSATSLTGSLQVTGNSTYSGSQTVTTGYITLTQVSQSLNFADDTAAAAGGVPLGGLYRNGNFIAIRIV